MLHTTPRSWLLDVILMSFLKLVGATDTFVCVCIYRDTIRITVNLVTLMLMLNDC